MKHTRAMTMLELVVAMAVLAIVAGIGYTGLSSITKNQDVSLARGDLYIVREAQRRYAALHDEYTPDPSALAGLPASISATSQESLTRGTVSLAVGADGTLALATVAQSQCLTLKVPPLIGALGDASEVSGTLPSTSLCDARSVLATGTYALTPGAPSDTPFYLTASRFSTGTQVFSNSGRAKASLDAVLGATTDASTDDPTYLPHSGQQYLYLPGDSNVANKIATSDSAALSVTGDLDLRVCATPSIWSSTQVLLDKTGAYKLSLTASGAVALVMGTTAGATTLTSSSSVPFIQGQSGCVRVWFDTNTGTGSQATFYTSANGGVWSSLGVAQTLSPSRTITDTSTELAVSPDATFKGSMQSIEVRSGEALTLVGSLYATGCSQSSCITTTGQTWTITRATSGPTVVVVDRDIFLFDGVDDFMWAPDNSFLEFGPTDSATVVLVVRTHSSFAAAKTLLSKRANAASTYNGWAVTASSSTFALNMTDGSGTSKDSPASPTYTPGDLVTVAFTRSGATSATQASLGLRTSAAQNRTLTASVANNDPLWIGRSPAGYAPFELVGVAFYQRALSLPEIKSVAATLAP
jgi:prepilin-type N-terminal cleavage/methylation domain-containing protein